MRALDVLAALHASRAGLVGRRRHPDQLAVAARREFLGEALAAMARRGQARILTLDVAGRPVAAQLVLDAPSGSYLGISGVDPQWWQASPLTLLALHAAEAAVLRGHREFNLSAGPSVSKLRWSEQVRQHPEFLVCGPRRSSRRRVHRLPDGRRGGGGSPGGQAEWRDGQLQGERTCASWNLLTSTIR